MPVKSIRSDNVGKIRDRIMVLIAKEMKRLNLHPTAAGISYNPKSMTMRLDLSVMDDDGNFEMPETQAFRDVASLLGLRPELVGQTMMMKLRGGTRKCEFVGFRSRASKFPFIVKPVRKGSTDNQISGFTAVSEKHLFETLRNNPGMVEKFVLGEAHVSH